VLNKLSIRHWLIWVFVFVIMLLVIQILLTDANESNTIDYTEFRDAVVAGHVASVEVRELEISGEFTKEFAEKDKRDVAFKTVGPVGSDLQDMLIEKDVAVTFTKPDDGTWQNFIPFLLLTVVIVVILVFFMRQLQGGNGKAMTFGKSRAKLLNESTNKVTFNDIAGIDEAKEELMEIVEFLKNPKKFTRLGGRIPKGVLLMGSPGTGKTLLARGVAGEAGVPFFSISGSDFVEMFVGVGASRVRDLFEQAKKNAPCIVFIDEIDAVGRHRGSGMGGGHDEREQTLNQLLVEMDGFESNEGVILIAATNRPDVLDPALLRPGRFDRRVVVAPPDVRGRELILKIHTRRTPVAKDVDLSKIARGTPGFSGADLENLVNEAALQAARLGKNRVETADFEHAKDKVLMGSERKSAVIGEKEKRVTAYHEAGHALVALLQDGTDPVHKVTIIPRGRALGVTQQLPDEDRHTMSKDYALKRLAVMMGGRAAEKVIFDELTTGAGNDIEVATDLARKMVCEWGMSEEIGPLSYSSTNTNPFPGYGGSHSTRPYSEAVAREIDTEVRSIVTNQYELAETLLRDNHHLLELMAQALLEFEALDRDEIDILMSTESLEPLRQRREEQAEADEQADEERVPKTGFTSRLKEQTIGSGLDLEPST
jgi:cell division protease FtsH